MVEKFHPFELEVKGPTMGDTIVMNCGPVKRLTSGLNSDRKKELNITGYVWISHFLLHGENKQVNTWLCRSNRDKLGTASKCYPYYFSHISLLFWLIEFGFMMIELGMR